MMAHSPHDETVRPGEQIIPDDFAWQLLGNGKSSESWIAWSAIHGYPITVKLAQTEETAQEARSVLRRESRRLTKVNHPAFQRAIGGDLDAPLPYIALDYIDGSTIGHMLNEEGPFDVDDAFTVIAELAAALGYLHRMGYAHLDLKPNNVVLRDGRVVVLDLGLSTRLGRTPSLPRGTKGYVAPEHWHGAAVAPTSDVFSLGAFLYELIAGRPAYTYKTEPTTLPDMARVAVHAPEAAHLVAKMMALDPADRLGSADVVLREVAALLPAEDRAWPDFLEEQATSYEPATAADWLWHSDAPRSSAAA